MSEIRRLQAQSWKIRRGCVSHCHPFKRSFQKLISRLEFCSKTRKGSLPKSTRLRLAMSLSSRASLRALSTGWVEPTPSSARNTIRTRCSTGPRSCTEESQGGRVRWIPRKHLKSMKSLSRMIDSPILFGPFHARSTMYAVDSQVRFIITFPVTPCFVSLRWPVHTVDP